MAPGAPDPEDTGAAALQGRLVEDGAGGCTATASQGRPTHTLWPPTGAAPPSYSERSTGVFGCFVPHDELQEGEHSQHASSG